MKITIESTTRIVTIVQNGVEVPARIWEGKTDTGIYVQCLVTRIAAPETACQGQFERELKESRPPSQQHENVFPLRMVL